MTKKYKICEFCWQPMIEVREHSGNGFFDLYKCFDCLGPSHKSMYRQLYDLGKTELLSDAIEIDSFYIIRYFSPGHINRRCNYTVINHDVIGAFADDPDLEPMTYRLPVCELDGILDLPFQDPELMLKKLQLYTTFS